ncbi:DUF6261 family protein [Riemerella anatipestifer]|uniref:DUF6261 family protein n=1 Tax=Riemerella anatipestifer TaxID=34085 RepID=UPI003DA7BB94
MKISLGKLKTVTLAALAERLISASKNGNYTISISNHPLLKALEAEYNLYKDLVAKQLYSGKGAEVAQADKERDKVFVGLKVYLKAYAALDLLPNQEKAVALYEVFKRNDLNLDKKSYADQSVLLNKLLAELDAEPNKTALNALNLTPVFNDLKTKQETFSNLLSEQTEANATLRLTKSASALRGDIEKSIRNYINLVSAMQSQTEWAALYKELNEIIKSAKNA